MYSHKEYVDLVEVIATEFNLTSGMIHDNVATLQESGSLEDIVRIIYDEKHRMVGLSFYIEVLPTIAIQVFSFVIETMIESGKSESVNLLTCYYEDSQGTVYTGIDARLASEQAKQDHYLKIFSNASDEELEEHLSRLEEEDEETTWH